MKYLILVLSLITLTSSNTLHKDTLLKIDKDGNIIGLPKEYNPSKFDLNKNYLRIKDKEIVIPECVSNYFRIYEKPELRLSASWYHTRSTMPYYLNFTISKENKEYVYSILIGLETLEVIDIESAVTHGNTTHYEKIKTADDCLEEYKRSITIIN